MTKQTIRPTIRETDVYERSSAIVVSLSPRYLSLRLKGSRESLNVNYDVLLDWLRRREFQRKAS